MLLIGDELGVDVSACWHVSCMCTCNVKGLSVGGDAAVSGAFCVAWVARRSFHAFLLDSYSFEAFCAGMCNLYRVALNGAGSGSILS